MSMPRCVGCGDRDHLVRFSIVPHVFRALLPLRFKEHSSHDIVLLCHSRMKSWVFIYFHLLLGLEAVARP